jgi:transcriptional regulator with XRE-family HTH domain
MPASLAGARIRALRSSAGLSAQALAQRSGVARGTLAQLERGEANPTVETLYAIANTLGVPLAELLASPADEPGVRVVRAGSGPSVPGGGLEANLLERFDRPGLVGELYAVRFVRGGGASLPGATARGCRAPASPQRARADRPRGRARRARSRRLRALRRVGAAHLRGAQRRGLWNADDAHPRAEGTMSP